MCVKTPNEYASPYKSSGVLYQYPCMLLALLHFAARKDWQPLGSPSPSARREAWLAGFRRASSAAATVGMYSASDPAATDPKVSLPRFQPGAVAAAKQAKRRAQQTPEAVETACDEALSDAEVASVSDEVVEAIAAAVGVASMCVDAPVSVVELKAHCTSQSSSLLAAEGSESPRPLNTGSATSPQAVTGKNEVTIFAMTAMQLSASTAYLIVIYFVWCALHYSVPLWFH